MLALSLSQSIRLYLESLHFFFRALHLLFALRFCHLLSSERDKSPFHKRSSIQACADTLHLLSHALHERSLRAVRLLIFCQGIVECRLTFTFTMFKRLYLTPSTDALSGLLIYCHSIAVGRLTLLVVSSRRCWTLHLSPHALHKRYHLLPLTSAGPFSILPFATAWHSFTVGHLTLLSCLLSRRKFIKQISYIRCTDMNMLSFWFCIIHALETYWLKQGNKMIVYSCEFPLTGLYVFVFIWVI